MDRRIGNTDQLCEALRVTASEGPAKGAELILVSNGKLNLVLNATNCLDITRLWHGGVNIGFLTKNGLYNVPDEFSRTFPAGMLYTCGLDNIGAREGFRIHGRIHSVPASIKELRADECGVKVVGEIRLTELFGENITVTRTVETAFGSGRVDVKDEIKNNGYKPEKYSMLYHVNAGYPLADDGAVIEGDFAESIARTPWAEENKNTMLNIEGPSDNMEEMVYFHRQNVPSVSIVNRKLKKKLTLEYSADTLPYLIEWKSRGSGDYCIGLEPATSWLDGYVNGIDLDPGKTVVNKISIEVKDI
ncbi:MAG: aldose 1-epimerase family protein [Clostridia bacterium]|nr:aldose 1-epimerase family protein [Clostridia bacterium]